MPWLEEYRTLTMTMNSGTCEAPATSKPDDEAGAQLWPPGACGRIIASPLGLKEMKLSTTSLKDCAMPSCVLPHPSRPSSAAAKMDMLDLSGKGFTWCMHSVAKWDVDVGAPVLPCGQSRSFRQVVLTISSFNSWGREGEKGGMEA